MTFRRRYLITYDVASDRRRAQVFAACRQQADHTQYSVFIAELSDRELVVLQGIIESLIHVDEDQVLFVDLGPSERAAGGIIASLGRPYQPPTQCIVV